MVRLYPPKARLEDQAIHCPVARRAMPQVHFPHRLHPQKLNRQTTNHRFPGTGY